jgi:hypothetical protein
LRSGTVVSHFHDQSEKQSRLSLTSEKQRVGLNSRHFWRASLPWEARPAGNGRYIMAVYDPIDDVTVYPVTAYEVPEPR